MDSQPERTEQDQQIYTEILRGINELAETVTGPLALFLPTVLEMVRPQVESVSPQDLRVFLTEARDKINGWLGDDSDYPEETEEPVWELPAPGHLPLPLPAERVNAERVNVGNFNTPTPHLPPTTEVIVLHRDRPEPEPVAEPVLVNVMQAGQEATDTEVLIHHGALKGEAAPEETPEAIFQDAPPSHAVAVSVDARGFGEWWDPILKCLTIRQPGLDDAYALAEAIEQETEPETKAVLAETGHRVLEYLQKTLHAHG